jgi:hypothetical protein
VLCVPTNGAWNASYNSYDNDDHMLPHSGPRGASPAMTASVMAWTQPACFVVFFLFPVLERLEKPGSERIATFMKVRRKNPWGMFHSHLCVARVLIAVVTVVFVGEARIATGENATPVIDTTRLLNAGRDTKNWLIPGHDYTNQRFVTLAQINTQNVKSLALRWKFQTGIKEAFQTTPLVADGVMYITTPKTT